MATYSPGDYTPEEADLIEAHLINAPGASHNQAPLYPLPPPRKKQLDTRLHEADKNVSRCRWCGAHALNSNRCTFCRKNGYPVI